MDPVLTRVIGGHGQPHIPVILTEQSVQVPHSAAYVLADVERISDAESSLPVARRLPFGL
jgi:hypothetical protein